MSIFRKKEPEPPAEERCTGCCCTCPASAPKCNKGRARFGLPPIPENAEQTADNAEIHKT